MNVGDGYSYGSNQVTAEEAHRLRRRRSSIFVPGEGRRPREVSDAHALSSIEASHQVNQVRRTEHSSALSGTDGWRAAQAAERTAREQAETVMSRRSLPSDRDITEAERAVKTAAGMGAPVGDIDYALAVTKFIIFTGLDPRDEGSWSSMKLRKVINGGHFGEEEIAYFRDIVGKVDVALKCNTPYVSENFCQLLDLIPKKNIIRLEPWLGRALLKFKNLADKTTDKNKIGPAQDVARKIHGLVRSQQAAKSAGLSYFRFL